MFTVCIRNVIDVLTRDWVAHSQHALTNKQVLYAGSSARVQCYLEAEEIFNCKLINMLHAGIETAHDAAARCSPAGSQECG